MRCVRGRSLAAALLAAGVATLGGTAPGFAVGVGGSGGGGGGSGGGGDTGVGGGPATGSGDTGGYDSGICTENGTGWVMVAYPLTARLNGQAPSANAINALITSGIATIAPTPIPNGGNGYTWTCYLGGVVSRPPAPPAGFAVESQTFPGHGTLTLRVDNALVQRILVGDLVSGSMGESGLHNINLTGSSAGGYSYSFRLRWVEDPNRPAEWSWQDGPPTTSSTHMYRHVAGASGIPARGIDVHVSKFWVPQCSALITHNGATVTDQGFGRYPCHGYPAGTTARTYAFEQTYVQTRPQPPTQIDQIEVVPG